MYIALGDTFPMKVPRWFLHRPIRQWSALCHSMCPGQEDATRCDMTKWGKALLQRALSWLHSHCRQRASSHTHGKCTFPPKQSRLTPPPVSQTHGTTTWGSDNTSSAWPVLHPRVLKVGFSLTLAQTFRNSVEELIAHHSFPRAASRKFRRKLLWRGSACAEES
jgi:hypothetical protein